MNRLPTVAGIASLVLLVTQADARCPTLQVNPDSLLATQVDALVDAAVADGFAGQVAIVERDALIYSRGAGTADLDGKVPVTDSTRFDVASITKYFTAILALRAVDEGRISLDASIADLAAETRLAARGTTWLDLMTHRAGLSASYVAEEHADANAALAAIDAQPLNDKGPGAFEYSNDAYDVVAILLEKVHAAPFEQLMRDKVLAPACLDGTRLWVEVDKTDPEIVAQPLHPFPERLMQRNYGVLGSVGMLTTAAQLVRLQHALASGRVLRLASWQALVEPREPISIGHVALGAFIIGSDALGPVLSARGAEDWGTNAILNHYLERDLIVAVVTSRGPEGEPAAFFRNRLSRGIEDILARRAGARAPR